MLKFSNVCSTSTNIKSIALFKFHRDLYISAMKTVGLFSLIIFFNFHFNIHEMFDYKPQYPKIYGFSKLLIFIFLILFQDQKNTFQ